MQRKKYKNNKQQKLYAFFLAVVHTEKMRGEKINDNYS